MRRTAAIAALLMCLPVLATAQNFLDHLQDKQQKGTVTVTQSKDISDLVNGKKNTPTAQSDKPKTAPATAGAKPAAPQTEKKTDTPHKPDSSKQHKPATEPAKRTADTITPDDQDTSTADTRKKVMRNSKKVTGYRVQAFAGGNSRTDRNKAQQAGDNIKAHFPSEPVYVHFYSPRWICRVGNYRTYEEAAEMLKEVKKLGYKSACIVKGKITVQY